MTSLDTPSQSRSAFHLVQVHIVNAPFQAVPSDSEAFYKQYLINSTLDSPIHEV